jgi:uncharacterized protein YndB with AHSA1/START domain
MSAVVTLPTETEIVITREFKAPAALLFKAYTTVELVKRWWGYAEDDWLVCDIDLRVDGTWRWVTKHSNENGEFEVPFHGTYQEIEPPTRLVYTEVFEAAPVPDPDALAVVNTITFDEVDGITTMTMVTVCPDQFTRDAIIESGMESGMQISMDRLEAVASGLAAEE